MTCVPGYLAQLDVSADNGATYERSTSLVELSFAGSTDELECSTHQTVGNRSHIPGLRGDTISLEFRYDKEDPAQRTVLNHIRPYVRSFKIRFRIADGPGSLIVDGDAFSTSDETSSPLEDISSYSVDLRISNAQSSCSPFPLGLIPAPGATLHLSSLSIDAQSNDSLSLNDPITTWRDLSGNARDFSIVPAGEKPLFRTMDVNGGPSLLFDGVDDSFDGGADDLDDYFDADAWHAFFVVAPLVMDAAGADFTRDDCLLTGSTGFIAMSLRTTNDFQGGNFATFAAISTVVLSTTPQILEVKYDGVSYSMRRNGGAYTVVAGSDISVLTGTLILGRSRGTPGLVNHFDGHFCEVLTYDRELSAPDTEDTLTYLGNLYAISV